jgi:hypothetical protein
LKPREAIPPEKVEEVWEEEQAIKGQLKGIGARLLPQKDGARGLAAALRPSPTFNWASAGW